MVAYLLKMYPRFSETFVLAEMLERERQGLRLHVISLKKPDDGVFHADVSRLRARVTYLPESLLADPGAWAAAHRRLASSDPRRYAASAARAIAVRRRTAIKHFLQAGLIAPLVPRLGISHVHAHFASAPAAVALHLHRLTGVSYSVTAHAKDIYNDTVDEAALAAKLASARFAVTVSDYNRRHLARLVDPQRLVRIYNGIDLERFSPNGISPAEPPLLLGVGRLIEKKGFEDLIRACAILARDGRRFSCAIVGKGPLESRLRALVDGLGIGDAVTFAGPVPQQRLIALYRRAAMVVAPCVVGSDGNRDGLPTVLIEAMALGVPVVSTDVTGIPELVQDRRTGLVVPPRDPHAIARAVGRLLDDRAAAASLARAARTSVEAEFDVRRNVARLRTLLAEAARS
jgi:colanic acid/amylovoran biosynthesis glycosyltransferase